MTQTDAEMVERAWAWLAEDPDPDTRAELQTLLDAGDDQAANEIHDRFSRCLTFGTAGLRGALGAGPNRMNSSVVIRAAAGLAAYLAQQPRRSVVIGYDARHKSAVFARDTAAVMTAAGIRAVLLPRPLPTPVLAFAVRHLDAGAGVMVTASHNPPQDNGYKVYLADGRQISAPVDAEIAERISAVGALAGVPRSNEWTILDDDVLEAYLDRVASLPAHDSPRDVRITYTPLHGVGRDVMLRALERAGFPAPNVVEAQAEPDPDFPTVAVPNPEEPGVMDLALEAAEDDGSDIVLAHDPDADRCAVACRGRVLRGDEVGVLLAVHLLGRSPKPLGTFAASIVSSTLLARIAEANDVPYQETLTGFKWIAGVDDLSFGYEEAIGYCVDPDAVRDKDGVSAALLLAELAADLKRRGRTLLDLLDDLAIEHGLHATDQLTVQGADPSSIDLAMSRLRSSPPVQLGGRSVRRTEDLSRGAADLPAADVLRYRLEAGARVIVRPSGTEPKLKCYLEVIVPVMARDVAAARRTAEGELDRLRRDIAEAAGLSIDAAHDRLTR